MERVKARVKECEADRRWLLRMLTTSQVNLAWVSEKIADNEKDLRILSRELRDMERLESEESA
jgi:hypothetical protein